MAFDAFLKIDDVQGEVTAAGHEGSIEVLSFSWGASDTTTIGSATTGAGGGKAEFAEFSITKNTDSASPNFFKNCVTGAHYKEVVLTLRKSGGGGNNDDFLKLDFQTVFVSSIQQAGAEQGDDRPTEEITFVFGQLDFLYTAPDGDVSEFGWDVVQNRAWTP